MRLFVDVDDTLILWTLAGKIGYTSAPNPPVIAFVERWGEQHPEGEIVVWSSGGQDYAADWGHKLLKVTFRAEAKWNRIPEPGDVFIDDDPWPTYSRATLHPREVA